VGVSGAVAVGGAGGAVRDAVRMEVRRLTTVRSTAVLLAIALLLGPLLCLLFALLLPVRSMSGDDTATVLTVGGDVAPLSVVGALLGVLGAVTVSHDYRYGLVRSVLAAVPRRGALMAARLTVLGVLAAGTATLVSVLGAVLCALSGRRPLLDTATLRVMAFQMVVVAGWAWLGAGLGWLLRHAGGVVAVLLVLPLAVEPVLILASQFGPAAFLAPVVQWLPFASARHALGRQLATADGTVGALPAVGAFAAATALVVGLAWLRVRRADA